jgi:hypothetical protein
MLLTIIIALLGLICGTIGAAFVWRDLRDSSRRFANRARLGLDTGLESYVPAGMRRGQQRLAGGGREADPSYDVRTRHGEGK